MVIARAYSVRWVLFLACIVFGTFMGIFFQRFGVTAPLFQDIVNFTVSVDRIDLLALNFGFHVGLRMNLGTLFGGIAGIWAAR